MARLYRGRQGISSPVPGNNPVRGIDIYFLRVYANDQSRAGGEATEVLREALTGRVHPANAVMLLDVETESQPTRNIAVWNKLEKHPPSSFRHPAVSIHT